MANDARGSIWRKWDLHIHTPASYLWRGPKFSGVEAHDDLVLADMIKAMNEADPVAFCIMDYWHFDGWFALQDYVARNPGVLKKKVFPGIELRLDAAADFKLNTHFLLDDSLSKQQVNEFLSLLRLSGGVNRAPSAEAFIQLAKGYSNATFAHHGYKPEERDDNARMKELGMKTAKITRESWHEAKLKFKDSALIIQPYDTSDGLLKLNWEDHPSDDTEIMKAADFFEVRKIDYIRLFLGAGHPTRADITENYRQALEGKWRPVVSGSDAHRFTDYGIYPSGKICWLKADISFAGLKQCMVDPIGRVFIGSEPPKRQHQHNNKTKYIKNIKIQKNNGSTLTEHWFNSSLDLNYGMVSIIGNKGSGKSALADIIALAGNSHCPSFEFLNRNRFRKISDNKSEHFTVTLTWSNGEEVTVNLKDESRKDHPERVRYLPQQYLEELCTEVGSEGANCFEVELKKVIFSHVPIHERLGFVSLDQVVQYQTEQIEHNIYSVRAEISALNKEIIELENAIKQEHLHSLQSQINLKKQELLAVDNAPPSIVEQPSQQTGEAAAIAHQIASVRLSLESTEREVAEDNLLRIKNTAASRALQRVSHALRNIQLDLLRSVENLSEDAAVAGIDTRGLINFSINDEPIRRRQENLYIESEELSASLSIFEEKAFEFKEILEQLQETASEPERLYQLYLQNVREWEARRNKIIGSKDLVGSLTFLQNQLDYLSNEAPRLLIKLEFKRENLTQRIYNHIQEQIGIYKAMYKPIETAASSHKFVQENIKLGFDTVIEASSFTGHLLSMINQGRRGTFYGQTDGLEAAHHIVQKTDFSSWSGLKAFLLNIISALKNDQRLGRNEPISIKSQLREQFTVHEVYDYIFGLSYL